MCMGCLTEAIIDNGLLFQILVPKLDSKVKIFSKLYQNLVEKKRKSGMLGYLYNVFSYFI